MVQCGVVVLFTDDLLLSGNALLNSVVAGNRKVLLLLFVCFCLEYSTYWYCYCCFSMCCHFPSCIILF